MRMQCVHSDSLIVFLCIFHFWQTTRPHFDNSGELFWRNLPILGIAFRMTGCLNSSATQQANGERLLEMIEVAKDQRCFDIDVDVG